MRVGEGERGAQTAALLHAVICPAAKTAAAAKLCGGAELLWPPGPLRRARTNPLTVCLSCSQNRPLKVGPQSEAQKQTLVMFEGCNCSSRVMFLFSL